MTAEQNVLPRALSLAVHELRTPVTVVAGYLRILLREQAGPLNDKQKKMLEEADRSCGRLTAIVAEMSELGKLEGREVAMARQEFDVCGLAAELASGMQEGQDRGVTLEVRSSSPIMVNGDRTRVAAALKALMHSALRERGEPGAIVVQCSTTPGNPSWAVVAIGDESALTPLAAAAPGAGAPPTFDEWRGGRGLALRSEERRV